MLVLVASIRRRSRGAELRIRLSGEPLASTGPATAMVTELRGFNQYLFPLHMSLAGVSACFVYHDWRTLRIATLNASTAFSSSSFLLSIIIFFFLFYSRALPLEHIELPLLRISRSSSLAWRKMKILDESKGILCEIRQG